MKSSSTRHLGAILLSASLVSFGAVGCGDDDQADSGTAGSSSAGKGGSGANGGSGGKGGNGGSKAGAGGVGGAGGKADADDAGVNAAVDSKAADLRVTLNLLLGEHLILAAKATGAALDARDDDFAAYGDLLSKNGTDVGALVGKAFGSSAETQFNGIWSAHNGFFVNYTTGVAKNDETMKSDAVKALTETYVPQFAKLLSGATGLPEKAVADLTTEHVLTTKAIVDAQAAKDWTKAYAAIRTAFAHMAMIGDPLSEAIAMKKPTDFPGDAAAKSVDFRVALNQLLQEHLYLATFATSAALGGRADEFNAAGVALNTNGTDLGTALRGLYGADAESKFNDIWASHNGFFVAYTTGVAEKDEAKKSAAVKALTETYVPQFAEFLAGATDLPKATLAELTTEHVLTTKAVVDAQGAGDATDAAKKDRLAAQHMQMIGDPLATAIVAKLPAKF